MIKAWGVMIIEDDPDIAQLIVRVLSGMGHDLCSIEVDESNAVATALRCMPDFMIVDSWLRKGDGVSAVERILRTLFIPHLFITNDSEGVRERRPDAAIVQKPFRIAELTRAIGSILHAENVRRAMVTYDA